MEQVGLGLELVKQCIDKGLYVCNLARNDKKMDELSKVFNANYKYYVFSSIKGK